MMPRVISQLHDFLNSKTASVVYTVLACLTVTFSLEHYAIPLFVLWCLFVLVLEKSFLNLFLPVILLNGFAIRTSGEEVALLEHVWLAVPVVAVIVLYFFIHIRHFQRGKMFFAQCGISAALFLGGVFSISAKEYFSADALYYTVFLGIGMVFFYLWFRNGVTSNKYYDCREKLIETLFCLGIFSAYSILYQALRLFLLHGTPFQVYVWGNDICELMLFAIPTAFYYAATRKYGCFLFGCFFYGVMIFTLSISAVFMGGIILLLCFVYLWVYRKEKRVLTTVLGCALLLCGAAALVWILSRTGGFLSFFLSEENGRMQGFADAWRNFVAHPLFGAGVGAKGRGEASILAMSWTHNLPLQVLGSMGLFGALAYGYQLYRRGKMIFKGRDPFRMACALSYFGLFLISLLQPGEFCPMPYAMMAVMIFTVLEISDAEKEKTEPLS